MLRKTSKCRLRILPILLIALVFLVHHAESCLKSAGENAAKHMRDGMVETSEKLKNAMTESIAHITASIRSASESLELSARTLASSLDTASQELGQSLRKASGDLVKIGDRLGDSVDNGVKELGGVMREAIDATRMISKDITKLADNAVAEVGRQIRHITDEIRDISKDLTNSIDKSVAELGSSIRYIGDKIVEISKQVQFRLNSTDLIHVARETKEGLVEAVNQLTTNWQVGVNTADLKDLGQAAAQELSTALQNINARVEVQFGINPELRRAILYIAVAGGFAFAVLFVALVISVKGCRNCCVQACTALGQGIASGNSKSNADGEIRQKEGDIMMETVGESSKMSPKPAKQPGRSRLSFFGRNNYQNNRQKRANDKESNFDELSDDSSENDGISGKKSNRRFTRTLADFKDFPTLQHKWEKKARKEKRQKLRDEQTLSPGKREESNLILK